MNRTDNAPVYVTLGGDEFVTIDVADTDGRSLVADVITAQLTKPGVKPTSWRPTSPVVVAGQPVNERTVQLLITLDVCPTPGRYDLWVRISDSPEAPIRRLPAPVVAG